MAKTKLTYKDVRDDTLDHLKSMKSSVVSYFKDRISKESTILKSAPTSNDRMEDRRNKAEVISSTTGINKTGAATRQALYDAYMRGGYAEFSALKNKFYSKTPQVYASDLGAARELHNARYQVNTIKDHTTRGKIMQAANNGTLELRILDDRGLRNAYDTAYNTRNMGRDKLVGINSKDRYVLYDSTTGQYYRYRNENDADYRRMQEDLATYEELYEAQVEHLKAVQEFYLGELNKQSGARYAATYENYTNDYTKAVLAVNETSNKLVELREEVNPNEEFKKNIDAQLDAYDAQRREYNKYNKYIADFNDPYQFNSFSDVLKELIHDTDKEPWINNLSEMLHYEFGYIGADELSGTEKLKIGFQNSLVNFGETMDIIATPVKALLNAESYGMSKVEAFKASIGAADGGGYYNFDYDTGFLPADLLLEVLSDPMTYVTFGSKAVADAAATAMSKSVKNAFIERGIEASDDLIEQACKLAARNARVSGVPVEAAVKDSITRALAKQDVHKALANLGDSTLPFSDADRAAKALIDRGYIGNSNKTLKQMYKFLEGTNLSQKQMDEVIQLSIKSWNELNDTAAYAAKIAASQKSARVIAATQAINKADDAYARTVRRLTLTPFTIPYSGLNSLSKWITGSSLPANVKDVVSRLWSTAKHTDTKSVVRAEAELINLRELADTAAAYAKELNVDDNTLKELKTAQQCALANVYNTKVSVLLGELEKEVKAALAQVDMSKLTKEEVYKIFDNAANKISNGEFGYAQLFAFISNESDFAKMLNSANINAYKSLNRLRNIASERALINSTKDLFNKMGNAIELLNKMRRDFNKEFGNDIPMRGVEEVYNNLKRFVGTYDFGDEMTEKMLDLDNVVHDLRWYTQNDDTIPQPLLDNMFMTLNDINNITLDKLSYKLNPEYATAVTKDLNKQVNLEDYVYVEPYSSESTKDVIRKIFEDARKNAQLDMDVTEALDKEVSEELAETISEEELSKLILTELDKTKLPDLDSDWIRISVSNVARKLALYNNPFVLKTFNNAINTNTPFGKVLYTATSLLETDTNMGYAVKKGAATLQTYKLEQAFMEELSTFLPSSTYLAVQDTLTDEVLSRANGLIRNMDCTSAASIELATRQITDSIIEGTQEHMQGLADDVSKVALMHNFDNAGNYFTMNGVNTAENVKNMMTASSDLLAKGKDAIADEAYRDVYYSITHTGKWGNPISISFGDSGTGEIRTFTFGVKDGVLNISDDTAKKLFGLNSGREFKKQMKPLLKGAYKDTQSYYDDINEYLSTILAHTTDGKMIRFVGFNSGITRTNQEAVFKHVRNTYNMVLGPFVDLGEAIRNIQFPDMYLKDVEASALEESVRKHVNNIARAQSVYDTLELQFGNVAEDLTSSAITLIADDVLRYKKNGTTLNIPSIAITNILDNSDLPVLWSQAQDLKKALNYCRANVKKLGVPDDLDSIVNMSMLKEMYETTFGQKLNLMNDLRKTLGNSANIRYVYKADEAKRWFKTTFIEDLNAQSMDSLHRAYKTLINYEQRIREVHIAEMFKKTDLVDAYRYMINHARASARYDFTYTAITKLDVNKMSNNQMLATLFALRKYTTIPDTADEVIQNDLLYILVNYREFLTKGVDIVSVEDMSRYNKFNTLYNIYDHTYRNMCVLNDVYDDVRAAEACMKLVDRNYDRTFEGLELAAIQGLSGSIRNMSRKYSALRDNIRELAYFENGNVVKSDDFKKAEAMLRNFMDSLDAKSNKLIVSTVVSLNKMTDEQLVAHLVGNCSGTLVLQLDSAALKPYITQVEALIKKVGNNPMFECSYKELNIEGMTHPSFIISTAVPDSADVIRKAIKTIDDLPLSKKHLPNSDLVENLPNRFVLSDYTPANAEATRRVLEFAGKPKKVANDIVQLYQKFKVFDAGCNNNVIGDYAFVKQFYPQKASNYMKNVQQMVVHNMNRIGGITYYTTIIKQGMFSLNKFTNNNVSMEQFKSLMDANKYVVCTLDDTGAPIAVKLTQDVYENAYKYSCVPVEWFDAMQDAWDNFVHNNVIDNRSSLQYKLGYIADTYSDLVNLRKQGWLFTHTATPIRNLIGGATNFVSDVGLFSGIKAMYTNFYSWLTYQRIYRDMQDVTTHFAGDAVTDAAVTEYFKTGKLRDLMDENSFRNHLQVALSSGGASDEVFVKMLEAQPTKLVNEAVKYSELDLSDLQIAEFTDFVRSASVDMNKIFNKYYDKVNKTYDFVAIQNSLNEYLNKSDSVWAQYLQPIVMQYMSKRESFLDITKIPVLGRYYKFNQDMFSNIESYLRDTAAMYYIQQGLTPKDAINQMLRTQFDYSDSGAVMNALNAISPFSTYKLKNLNYWLLEGNTRATTIRFGANLATYQGITNPMEMARSFYWANYYKEHPEEAGNEAGILEQITQGSASNFMFQSTKGKWKISKNHYLKNSAPFFEASELWTQVITAMTNYEYFETFLLDNIYSPYATTATFLSDLLNGEVDEQYYADHYYEINDMVPVFGALVNSIIGKAKAANTNNISVTDLKALYAFGERAAEDTINTVLDVLAVTWSSMIGTSKESKPVGYLWNQQSEEYKATHRFVFGVSALPTAFTKDPAKYVDHLGSLVELGYSKEEAIELLSKGWYFDADGNVHQYKIYEDEDMPNVFKYNADMFDNTLRYLLARGYDIDSAYTYMKTFGKWVDEEGNVRGMDDVELLWEQSLEKDRYYKLPAYIRNMPNQYSTQLKYYKEQGYTSDEAKFQMQTNPVLITDSGEVVVLTAEQLTELNSAYKYNPKYQKDAEAGQAAKQYTNRSTANLGKLKTFSTPDTERTEGGRQYQASSYPARYRRPKKIHHSFTYDSIYGLNNIARNRMDVAMSHTHYRSANRYRAEAVRNRFRYL